MGYSLFKDFHPDGGQKEGFGPDRYWSGLFTLRFFTRMPCFLLSGTVYRKAVLRNFFFDEYLKNANDIDFFLRLSVKTKFLCVPSTSVIRRKTPDSISESASLNISPNTVLTLERFYHHCGRYKIIPARIFRRKISREYRGLARKYYRRGCRHAAVSLLKKAIGYYPFDPQYYREFLKALLLNNEDDNMPDWQMPEPLPPYITVSGKKIPFKV